MLQTELELKYYLEIKEPCHESWEKMSPTVKGKFCAACEKEVIDFTHFGEREVLSVLKNAKGNVCGRIQPQRLNYPIEIEKSKSTFRNVKQLAASFLLLNFVLDSSNELKAQGVLDTMVVDHTIRKAPSVEIKDSITEKILRGTIRDEVTGEIIYGANILLKGSSLGAIVDYNSGEFVLKLPSILRDTIELEISFISYETKCLKLSTENLPEKLEVVLQTSMIELQMIGAISYTRGQRIRNFFRRIF